MRPERVAVAIGDDAAAFVVPENEMILVTRTLLVERIHFLRDAVRPEDLGRKALAVNLSDIAAMGGTAREAFVSIAIPGDCPLEYVEDMYRGMRAMAGEYGVNILGGIPPAPWPIWSSMLPWSGRFLNRRCCGAGGAGRETGFSSPARWATAGPAFTLFSTNSRLTPMP